jgi:hypothetical protein
LAGPCSRPFRFSSRFCILSDCLMQSMFDVLLSPADRVRKTSVGVPPIFAACCDTQCCPSSAHCHARSEYVDRHQQHNLWYGSFAQPTRQANMTRPKKPLISNRSLTK